MRTNGWSRAIAIALTVSVACVAASCVTRHDFLRDDGIRAIADPALIARGRYLVYGPAHCAACHGDPSRETDIRAGKEVPLSGGRAFDLGPVGTVTAPNITSDPTFGIGAMSDELLVRALRYGVSRHGEPLVPIMPFARLADEDLSAVVAFVRTLAPVSRPVAARRLSWLGRLALELFIGPSAPEEPPPKRVPAARTAAYGRYLAHTVANCHGCHTRRSKLHGRFVGEPFRGGMQFREADVVHVSPDITGATTGILSRMDESQFIARFRAAGATASSSPMPWGAYARMTDDDLGAIYRYLRTLPGSETDLLVRSLPRAAAL